MKLDVKSFALTTGIVYGLGLFLLTWWVIAFEGITHDPTFIGRVLVGFQLSPVGSVIGLIWGAVGGGIIGAAFAALYNRLLRQQPVAATAAPGPGSTPAA